MTVLKKALQWFRAGYPADGGHQGHVGLIALCPSAYGVIHPRG